MVARTRKPDQERFSYADYQKWPTDERFEIIDGISYAMNAPLRIHQKISGEIFRQFANYLKGKTCEIYTAPFDVRFPIKSKKEGEIFNVVQPDLAIVCDQNKLDEKGCIGAPDLIVEILSQSSLSYDNVKKRALYEKMGVKEFWLAHPTDCMIMAYRLQNGAYGKPEIFDRESGAVSALFADLKIDLVDIFGPAPENNMVKEAPAAYSTLDVDLPIAKKAARKRTSGKNRP